MESGSAVCHDRVFLNGRPAMDRIEIDANSAEGNSETESQAYVPPLQLTKG